METETGLSLYTDQRRITEIIKHNMQVSAGKLKGKLKFNHAFIDLEGRCNFACEGCFKGRNKVDRRKKVGKLTFEEVKKIVGFAKGRGAKVIVFAGEGETTMDADFRRILRHISSQGLYSVVFTNGTLINNEFAHFIFQHQASLILKRLAVDNHRQDQLLGTPGGSKMMGRGLEILLKVKREREAKGLPVSQIAIDCYIIKQNIDQVADVLRWCRRKKLIPYFESCILSQDPVDNQKHCPSQGQLNGLFEKLAEVDLEEFGVPTILWPGSRIYGQEGPCFKPRSGFAVQTDGRVTECVSGEYTFGNLRKTTLDKIFDLKRPRIRQFYSAAICPAPRCSLVYTGYRTLNSCQHSGVDIR
ncbi:MAG TPA: radical SAM protein [Candidatus Bathyarchaeia archaeon]|nr:radical SAM protein [Candidatus Bathyarchaeia archaeon]